MSFDAPVIHVEGLSKAFSIYSNPRDRLKQLAASGLSRLLRRAPKHYFSEFWALNDINFTVARGETVGIIGHNGSGKSTLLQLICGTLSPTHGCVETTGRVAALLELGSGFNPEFSGRENIFLNGAILGLDQSEVEARFDSIAGFADIGEFIERPVKTYSSGMALRLAFAVQSQVDPDILIVDEALAVGDARFQAKCFDRLRQLKEQGTSILLVTHSGDQIVNHCDRALLLDAGKQLMLGEPKVAVNHYLDLLFGREKRVDAKSELELIQGVSNNKNNQQINELSRSMDRFSERLYYNPTEHRWGDGAACITDFELSNESEQQGGLFESGVWIRLRIAIRFDLDVDYPILGVTIKTKEGVTVFGTNTINIKNHGFEREGRAGTSCIVAVDIHNVLTHEDYFISIGVASKDGEDVVPHDRRYDSIHFQVAQTSGVLGMVNLETKITLEASS